MLTNQFPGVHVFESSGGARPIASIATSNTVFIDTFQRGPVNEARRITSWADFQKIFGGLWKASEASYGVQQYFQNGGAVAFIIRTPFVTDGEVEEPATFVAFGTAGLALAAAAGPAPAVPDPAVPDPADPDPADPADPDPADPDPADPAPAAVAADTDLGVSALNGGSWGNNIRVGVVHHATDAALYTLLVREYLGAKVVAEEVYQDLTTDPDAARFADKVINGTSRLIAVTAPDGTRPAATSDQAATLDKLKALSKAELSALTGGGDGFLPGMADFDLHAQAALIGNAAKRTGMSALENIVPDVFNTMCIPVAGKLDAANAKAVYEAAEKFCRDRFAFLLVDPDDSTHDKIYGDWFSQMGAAVSRNAAGYYPRLTIIDTADGGKSRAVAPSGMVAGMMARIDATRGVWKSTAGTETRYAGGGPAYLLTDLEQEPLNRLGINAIRSFPVYGDIIWGARTLAGADDLADEYKYIAVRRTALFIQQSLQRGLKWTVFEANDEGLWGQIRMNVGSFMRGLHKQGAFQGKIAADAYLVKCDGDTTTQSDIDLGIVNILVAFAPVKPAEFVLLEFQQLTKLPE